MESLPEHVLLEIFKQLDHSDVDALALVSRSMAWVISRNRSLLEKATSVRLEFMLRPSKSAIRSATAGPFPYDPNDPVVRITSDKDMSPYRDMDLVPCNRWYLQLNNKAHLWQLLGHFQYHDLTVIGNGQVCSQPVLEFIIALFSSDRNRTALLEGVRISGCDFTALTAADWCAYLARLANALTKLDHFAICNCKFTSGDFKFPAMLASGLIWKIRRYDEMGGGFWSRFQPMALAKVLPRAYGGFLQHFFITNAENPIWNGGDVDLEQLESASENEQLRPNEFKFDLAADQLKVEDILVLIKVWLHSPKPGKAVGRYWRVIYHFDTLIRDLQTGGIFKALSEQQGLTIQTGVMGDYFLVQHPLDWAQFIGILRAVGNKYIEIVRSHRMVSQRNNDGRFTPFSP